MGDESGPARDAGRARLEGADLLERLLGQTHPHDARRLARELIGRFGSLLAILNAKPEAIDNAVPGQPEVADLLNLVHLVFLHALRRDLLESPILTSSQSLADYLHAGMAHRSTEEFRILFLDAGNRLLRDEVLGIGSASQVAARPRQIMTRALELGATALILVHNHPSGDPRPSAGDVDTTRRIAAAARALEITIHDHIIVARSGIGSFRALGLLR